MASNSMHDTIRGGRITLTLKPVSPLSKWMQMTQRGALGDAIAKWWTRKPAKRLANPAELERLRAKFGKG